MTEIQEWPSYVFSSLRVSYLFFLHLFPHCRRSLVPEVSVLLIVGTSIFCDPTGVLGDQSEATVNRTINLCASRGRSIRASTATFSGTTFSCHGLGSRLLLTNVCCRERLYVNRMQPVTIYLSDDHLRCLNGQRWCARPSTSALSLVKQAVLAGRGGLIDPSAGASGANVLRWSGEEGSSRLTIDFTA